MENENKTPVIVKIMLFSLLYCIAVLFFTSCKSFEKITDTKQEKLFVDSDRILMRMDSIVKNGAIKDAFNIPLPVANTGDFKKDEVLNKELLELVKRLSTQKSSGGNSYELGFDEKLNEIYFKAFIQATENIKSIESKKDSLSSISEIKNNSTSDKKVYVMPTWLWLTLIGGGLYIAVSLFKIIIPILKNNLDYE
jgi:hypothetical protein